MCVEEAEFGWSGVAVYMPCHSSCTGNNTSGSPLTSDRLPSNARVCAATITFTTCCIRTCSFRLHPVAQQQIHASLLRSSVI
jgi:hypothetical protein